MFIPIFIAILMGLISPVSHTSNCNKGGTVYVNNRGPEDPGTGQGGNPSDDGPGPGGPGGDAGQNPPPKP